MARTTLSLADALSQFTQQNPDLPESDNFDASTPDSADRQNLSYRLDIAFERKGRAGKQATIVCGFPSTVSDEEIRQTASDLKRRLGVGGSVRGGEILFQGDQRQKLLSMLNQLGYKARII